MGVSQINVAIIGASGYTGADAVRLLAAHPRARIAALTGNAHAGRELAEIYPQFADIDVPTLARAEDVDWTGIDAAICDRAGCDSQNSSPCPDYRHVGRLPVARRGGLQ